MSISPLRFGTEKDFALALMELRWIKKIHGKLTEDDFKSISLKYSLPKEFLKEGLKGLAPDDCMISKSKWFPVVYAWRKHHEFLGLKHYKHCVWYWRSKLFYYLCAAMIGLVYSLLIYLYALGHLTLVTFAGIGLSLIFFTVPFLYHLRDKVCQWEERLAEVEEEIRSEGLEEIIKSTYRFLSKFKVFSFAIHYPKEFLQWISSAPRLSLFHLGVVWGFRKGKPIPIPIAFAENPDQAYVQRLKELTMIE